MKYRKKPLIIDAIQFKGTTESRKEIQIHLGTNFTAYQTTPEDVCFNIIIKTLEGSLHLQKDDWVIRGVKGESYPCKPDIFEKIYDKVEESWDEDEIESDDSFESGEIEVEDTPWLK